MPLFALALGIVCFASAFLVLGLWHMSESHRVLIDCLAELEEDEVVVLANECMRVFSARFEERLSLDNLTASVDSLERVVMRQRLEPLKRAFASEEIYWRYVVVVGAFLGELVRRQVPASWIREEDGLALRVADGRTPRTLRPFELVLHHVMAGHPGELRAQVRAIIEGSDELRAAA